MPQLTGDFPWSTQKIESMIYASFLLRTLWPAVCQDRRLSETRSCGRGGQRQENSHQGVNKDDSQAGKIPARSWPWPFLKIVSGAHLAKGESGDPGCFVVN